MHTPASPDADTMFDIYIAALRQAFAGERWSEVEPYAHRVWAGCCGDADVDWTTIKERARREWRG